MSNIIPFIAERGRKGGGTVETNINYSTRELVEELASRTGVKKITAEPERKYSVDAETVGLSGEGPAVILVVTD